jgi:hypothetical protein
VISPGVAQDQSSYRTELAGIYSIAFIVMKICQFYHVHEGSVTIGCDGLSALGQVFDAHVDVEASCHDLILATRRVLQESPIEWKYVHVKGHQDNNTNGISTLDRWAQLNIAMDANAKKHLVVARQSPRHQDVWKSPWSLWIVDRKITSQLSHAIYSIVHDPIIKDYRTNKVDISSDSFYLVDWEVVGTAMQESKRARRVFISKHLSSMCGIGKLMLHWKEWEHDLCPRCSSPEDSSHVWICQGFDANDIWESSLLHLTQWLHKVDTHPDLIEVILAILHSWREGQLNLYQPPLSLQHLLEDQMKVGGRRFFEGWLVKGWSDAQQRYYFLLHSQRSGRRWTVELLQRLWDISWDLLCQILKRLRNNRALESSRTGLSMGRWRAKVIIQVTE